MKYPLLSPLAIVCSLCILYPPSDHQDVVALDDDFLVEEFSSESLSENWESSFPLAQEESSPLAGTALPEQEEALPSPEKELLALPESKSNTSQPLNNPLLLVDETDAPLAPVASSLDKSSFFSIGGNYAYAHIKVHHYQSFRGNLGGMQGLYEYKPYNQFYGALDLRWRQGETHAAGATRFLVDVTAEERLGYTLATNDNTWRWTLFSGLGYRYVGHHLKESAGYMRFNYNTFYCPVGLFAHFQVYPYFSWGVNATWMPQFFPTVTIVPLKGARWKVTSQFANVLLEMPFSFHTGQSKQFSLTLKPTFQYWKDGHSTARTSAGAELDLPGNTYFFYGADLNLGYAF